MRDQLRKFANTNTALLLLLFILLFSIVYVQKGLIEKQADLAAKQMVDSYLDNISRPINSKRIETSFILARTRTLLHRLQQLDHKREIVNILRFISEAFPEILKGDVFEQDPQSEKYFIDLSDSDLSETELDILEIREMRIWNSVFDSSHFHNFSCFRCGFNHSSFKNAYFSHTDFEGSDFTGANFLNSNIEDAHLSDAIFDNAIWSDGRKCAKNSIGQCN